MDIPARGSSSQRPRIALPEIVFEDPSERSRTIPSNPYNPRFRPMASPVSIPNSREAGPPPPLPPPRHIDGLSSPATDIAWHWGNQNTWGNSQASVKPGSSLLGSFASARNHLQDGRPQFPRKGSSVTTIKPIDDLEKQDTSEGYDYRKASHKASFDDLPSPVSSQGFQSSVHDGFRSSNAQAYDKSLLQKLDSRRGSITGGAATTTGTPPRVFPKTPFSSSANDTSPTSRISDEHRQQLKPLSLPEMPKRRDSSSDEFSRWSSSQAALSPRNAYSNQQYYDYKTSNDFDSDRSPLPLIRRSGSNAGVGDDASSTTSHSHRGSYDQNIFPDNDTDFPMEETGTGMRRLHIDDSMTSAMEGLSPGSTAGIKRRASSPPRDDSAPPSLHNVGSASDLFQRRVANSRMSPQPFRYHHSQSGSVSSTSSLRGSSFASNLSSLTASSISTMSSYGRLSPGGLSPATDLSDSPFLNSALHSPTGSISSSRPMGHQRNISEVRPLMTSRKLSDTLLPTKPQHGGPRLQGIFICECCPKKPKKFDTPEELAAHELEKQYECAYCRNRFKNKNEAERHQNSLHLRRHSWSCAALDGYSAAFHASPSALNSSDACGYCGAEFPRTGGGIATDKDWDIRIEHLQNVHKFGECNHAKKFFRADHFRQHLKHSHAGTSGKWTNMLENACMKDEPPEPIRGHDGSLRASTSSQGGLRPVEEDE